MQVLFTVFFVNCDCMNKNILCFLARKRNRITFGIILLIILSIHLYKIYSLDNEQKRIFSNYITSCHINKENNIDTLNYHISQTNYFITSNSLKYSLVEKATPETYKDKNSELLSLQFELSDLMSNRSMIFVFVCLLFSILNTLFNIWGKKYYKKNCS